MAPIKPFHEVDNSLLEEYLKRLVEKDKDALIALYQSTKSNVYGFILSILKNKHDSEDVFQEVYIKIYENAEMYQQEGKPLAWILTIAKNLCYMRLRKSKEHMNIDDLHEILPSDKKDNTDDRIILTAAFKEISDEERTIIMMHIVSGLKFHEISKILDLRLSTVLSKYHRGLKKLKKVIKEDIYEK